MTKLLHILKRPYPLNIELGKNLPYLIGFGIFVTLFLILFQPLGLSNYRAPNKNVMVTGIGLTFFIVSVANFHLISRILPKAFSKESWTLGREIVWNVWLCLTIILACLFYWIVVSEQELTAQYLIHGTLNSLLFTIFLMPTCVMLNYIRLIKTKLRKAEEITDRLQVQPDVLGSNSIELASESGREKLRLPAKSLLFIQSCDNYANVIRQKNGEIEEVLLRSSLKNLENQLSLPYIVRCHRSFIVNLSRVRSVVGNARNYTLLLGNCDTTIPVSRETEKKVLRLLEDINVE